MRRSAHEPGRVAVDLAVLLADGGEAIADLAVLRQQLGLFGAVASDAAAWRVLDSIDEPALAWRARPPRRPRWSWSRLWPSWVPKDVTDGLVLATGGVLFGGVAP